MGLYKPNAYARGLRNLHLGVWRNAGENFLKVDPRSKDGPKATHLAALAFELSALSWLAAPLRRRAIRAHPELSQWARAARRDFDIQDDQPSLPPSWAQPATGPLPASADRPILWVPGAGEGMDGLGPNFAAYALSGVAGEANGADDAGMLPPGRDVLLLTSNASADDPALRAALEMSQAGRLGRIGIYHQSDEIYTYDPAVYTRLSCVIREYWAAPLRRDPRVLTVPLGCWRPLAAGSAALPSSARRHVWAFMGQVRKKPSRREMLRRLRSIGPAFVHVTQTFGGADGLSAEQYGDALANAAFTPCPAGFSNLDSFRLYEALEVGSIPIVERRRHFDYFRALLGDHPLPTVSNWHEGAALIARFKAAPLELDALQERCVTWWRAAKAELPGHVARFVERSFGSAARP